MTATLNIEANDLADLIDAIVKGTLESGVMDIEDSFHKAAKDAGETRGLSYGRLEESGVLAAAWDLIG